MQRNWIGRSEGATVEFVLDDRRAAGSNETGAAPWQSSSAAPADFSRRRQIATRPKPRSRSTPRASIPSSAPPACSSRPSTRWSKQFAQADERLAAEVASLLEEQKKAREDRRPGGRSTSTAASPGTTPSTLSAESGCPSGWPTTSCSSTEPAPSCRCPRMTSAILSLPKNTAWKSASSFCPGALASRRLPGSGRSPRCLIPKKTAC